MNVLIWGAGFCNKGAEAMLRTVTGQLGERLPGLRFKIEAIAAENQAVRSLGAEPWIRSDMPWTEPWEKWSWRWRRRRELKRRLADVDALIDISGFAFGGAGTRSIWRLLSVVDPLRQAGKPYVMMPQAWGPFPTRNSRRTVTRLLKHAERVYARDAVSLAYLDELAGISHQRIEQAPDITFAFEPTSPVEAEVMLAKAGIAQTGEPLIGLAPNMRIYQRMGGEGEENAYVKMLTELAVHFVTRRNCAVLLVPHELMPEGASLRDDRYLCRLVRDAATKRGVKISAFLDDANAAELKSMIGLVDGLIGSRFHAVVGAISQHVPTMAIGWSHKYDELLTEMGLGEYALSYRDMNTCQLVRASGAWWESRVAISQHLTTVVSGLADRVELVFDQLADVLSRDASAVER